MLLKKPRTAYYLQTKNYCMKQMTIQSAALQCLLLVSVTSLFSFSEKMGGDSFAIYLNGKTLVQQYVAMNLGLKILQVDQLNNDITVYYRHCGKTGKDRSITIRGNQNRVLKTWHFQNDDAIHSAMNCKLKDIPGLQKTNKTGNLQLYYTSSEIPGSRLLATLVIATENKIALKQ
jgi:hypothetical protein